MKKISVFFGITLLFTALLLISGCSALINPSIATISIDAPSNVTAKTRSSYNKITWDSVDKADYYYIYRNTTNNPSTSTKLDYTSSTSFSDYTRDDYTSYYYWVAAYYSKKEIFSPYSSSAYCEAYLESYTPNYGDYSYVPSDAINFNDYISDTLYTPVSLAVAPEYIYFSATKGKYYSIKWADKGNGSSFITNNSNYKYSQLVDVKVKCFVAGDPYRNLSDGFDEEDNGYDSEFKFKASYSGYYIIEVNPKYSDETGWWALKVSESSY